nr:gastrula zinc finger protein XlCGF49.1-like [Maniola hyperantus]
MLYYSPLYKLKKSRDVPFPLVKARDNNELHCSLCDKRFASVATYRQHLRVSRRHVSEKDFTFMCNECGKKFVNKTRLRDHIDWEHLNKIKFRCQLCNKPFKCHTSLYVHMQNVHKNKEKKENLCHVCGKSYPNAAKLKYHIVAMHTSETPYRCAQCGAAFGWYSSLYRHVREVHYKMKLQPNKIRKQKMKKPSDLAAPLQGPS